MIYRAIEKFKCHLKKRGYSPKSITSRCGHLKDFASYLEREGICDVRDITLSVLSDYYRDIYWRRSSSGRAYTSNTISTKIYALQSFFRYLLAENHILTNPAIHLRAPKLSRIPKVILTLSEVEALLSQPDLKTFRGIRDKAILELFYSTGIRRQELVDLDVHDLNLSDGTITVRKGKGGKARVIPIGKWSTFYLREYLEEREKREDTEEKALFTSEIKMKRVNSEVLCRLIREYAKQAGITKQVSCHTLRHTCAVHFLEGGADVRSVQALLGHRHLGTTQVYLTVSRDELKRAHEKHHPRGKLKENGE